MIVSGIHDYYTKLFFTIISNSKTHTAIKIHVSIQIVILLRMVSLLYRFVYFEEKLVLLWVDQQVTQLGKYSNSPVLI